MQENRKKVAAPFDNPMTENAIDVAWVAPAIVGPTSRNAERRLKLFYLKVIYVRPKTLSDYV